MVYELAYDATHGLYEFWWLPLIPLAMAALARALPDDPPPTNVFKRRSTFALFTLGLTVLVATAVVRNGYRLRRQMRAGVVRVIEGTVREFVPGDPSSGRVETFVVRNDSQAVRFEYHPSRVTAGYHTLQHSGGIFREGLRVRIAYLTRSTGLTIARVEIARS